MQIVWELPARMAAEQLSQREKEKLAQSVQLLVADWSNKAVALKVIGSGGSGSVYSFRVGQDVRVILTRRAASLVILDVVRNSQIEKLASALKRRN
jgi:hypothetical protein